MNAREKDRMLREIRVHLRAATALMGDEELSPRQRAELRIRWSRQGLELGVRAAEALDLLAAALPLPVPVSAADLREQGLRVRLAHSALAEHRRGVKRAEDAQLRERARLHDMVRTVLQTFESLAAYPGLDPAVAAALDFQAGRLRQLLKRRRPVRKSAG